jgi:AraC-like DNA-binding protein
MRAQTQIEQVRMWRIPELPGIDLLRAAYVRQSFTRHTHEGFAVGVIEKGALGFFYRGENVVASKGAVNLANPDEAHTGHAALPEGWAYRMFYLHADVLKQAACQVAEKNAPIPYFPAGVIQDDHLAGMVRNLHILLEDERTLLLEKESLLLLMLSHLIRKHSDAPPLMHLIGKERSSIRRARDFMEAHCAADVSIGTLSAIACLSPFHFIRVFNKELGLPPHAYLKQARVRKAKELLSSGWSITAAALETGFVDQSHLNRNFKHIFGITPGQFRNFVQDTQR